MSINLSQSSEENIIKKKKERTVSRTFLVSFFVLILMGVLYGGVFFYKKSLISEGERITLETKAIMDAINTKDVQRVVDFERRNDSVRKFLSPDKNYVKPLRDISRLIIPSVVLISYEFTNSVSNSRSIHLIAEADSVDVIASQMLTLKESNQFSSVSVKEISHNDAGRVNFELDLQVADLRNNTGSDNEIQN